MGFALGLAPSLGLGLEATTIALVFLMAAAGLQGREGKRAWLGAAVGYDGRKWFVCGAIAGEDVSGGRATRKKK